MVVCGILFLHLRIKITLGKMEKILTIIVPTYNMEAYLRKCLDSLILDDEDARQVEVLVVNDGSTDSSSFIGHEYEEKHKDTFRIIDKENGNYGSCINKGLSEANGKYVKVLDADDSFDPEAFRQYVSTLRKTDADLILTDFKEVNAGGEDVSLFTFSHFPKNIVSNFRETLTHYQIIPMHSVTYRTDMLREARYKQIEGVSYSDTQWVFTPMASVNTFYYYPICLYRYLVGREGQTMDPKVEDRSLGHIMVVAKNMAVDYNDANSRKTLDSRIDNFLKTSLYWTFEKIFRKGLIYNKIDNAQMSIFYDDVCASCPEAERIMDAITIHRAVPVKYVEMWRNFGKRKLNPILRAVCALSFRGMAVWKRVKNMMS